MTESLTEQLERIRDAWYASHTPKDSTPSDPWVVEVLEEAVIIENYGQYFCVSYI